MFGNTDKNKVVIRPHDISGNGFDVLAAKKSSENDLIEIEGYYSDAESSLKNNLRSVVNDYGLHRRTAVIVLPHSSYSHFTINRPNMPQEEIRASLYWACQEKLDNMPYHTPILDACYAPESLGGKEHNKMHVFVAEESHIRKCVDQVKKAGLKVSIATTHELAANALLRRWSGGKLVLYLDIPDDTTPSLIISLDGDFVAYKKLPSINLHAAVDIQRDQFSLFFGEVFRQLTYFSGCVEENTPVEIFGSGQNWHNLVSNELFKNVFHEKFPNQSIGSVPLEDVMLTEGLDQRMIADIKHDVLGGMILND
jgi:hypothetical protein